MRKIGCGKSILRKAGKPKGEDVMFTEKEVQVVRTLLESEIELTETEVDKLVDTYRETLKKIDKKLVT